MSTVLSLDCTLRDGGYCNNWQFGEKNINKIIEGIYNSGIDIIECGYLGESYDYNSGSTKYQNLSQIDPFLSSMKNSSKTFAVMINYGDYDVAKLPNKSETTIDGIRIAFHKRDLENALLACRIVKEKGYKVFVQPMVTMNYSDDEFCELIEKVNLLAPYAVYVVDSFGTMRKKDVIHYWKLLCDKTDDDIVLGFHSHNNLQGAMENAFSILEHTGDRIIIIDSSIYGMGRGAGNLNTELFLTRLNMEHDKNYIIKPLLSVMDEVINNFYEKSPWGYSLPNYLSASHMIHPNYAGYLCKKKTLTIEAMDAIFELFSPEMRVNYNEKYIEELYIKYMSRGKANEKGIDELKRAFDGRTILLIAPGENATKFYSKVCKFSEERNPIVISINHNYKLMKSDYIFVSNIRRFGELDQSLHSKVISTSNINSMDTLMSIDYFSLLNSIEAVRDNAALMAIKLLKDYLSVKKIYVAGFDGYTHDISANFGDKDMAFAAPNQFFDEVNEGIRKKISDFRQEIDIEFITKSLFQ